MQIIKTLLIALSIGLVSCFFLFPNLAQGNNEKQYFHTLSHKDSLADEAFTSIADSFTQMTSILSVSEFNKGYYFLSEARQRKEVYDHLQQAGFESSLAWRIIAAYLLWEPDLARMVLIPADGLPIIKPQDRAQIEYFGLDDNTIIFRLNFYNCYQTGDQYILFVIGTCEEGRWLISEWQLFEG